MTTKAQREQDRNDAIELLRKTFPAGSVVNTVIRHVSASGMTRAISVLAIEEDGRLWNVSGLVARALDWKLHPQYPGVKVTGAGMDMAFHLVYSLSAVLYGYDEVDGRSGAYALKHNSV
jgi:hypothetical protein